jgi:hypothetical protein
VAYMMAHVMSYMIPGRRRDHAVRKSGRYRRRAKHKTGDKKTRCQADGTQTHETHSLLDVRLNNTPSVSIICVQ